VSNGHNRDYEAGVDREIAVKGIVVTGVVLAVIVVASAALMWFMSKGLRSSMTAADPAPSVLLEAQVQEPPPEPRLQTSPEHDMRELRAEESAALDNYQWVDEAAGVAQVPIERAMEMLAHQEVPLATPEATQPEALEPPAEVEPEAAPDQGTEGK